MLIYKIWTIPQVDGTTRFLFHSNPVEAQAMRATVRATGLPDSATPTHIVDLYRNGTVDVIRGTGIEPERIRLMEKSGARAVKITDIPQAERARIARELAKDERATESAEEMGGLIGG